MRKELEQKLYEKYPKIFIEKDLSPQESCMSYGLSFSDGWYDIVDQLCENIQRHCDENDIQVVCVQAKEKFGSLSFYISEYNDYLCKVVNEAWIASSKTCEYCGSQGKSRSGGWIKTLCDDCDVKNKNGYRPWREEEAEKIKKVFKDS